MLKLEPLSTSFARELIDFGATSSVSKEMADEQLAGAVAIHNIAAREGFAYLADEVGMGKTYVALGAVALMRFFHPHMRVLYIAPRENIQEKWIKELLSFTRDNWRVRDLRVRSVHDGPCVDVVQCKSLQAWTEEVVRDPDRDVFLRMTSFSFGLSDAPDQWRARRDKLTALAPRIDKRLLDLRSKDAFKDAYACALNTVLPHYDLVLVDEAHNFKHGRGKSVAARNRLLSLVLGCGDLPEGMEPPEGYGRRVDRAIFLSATPLEADYADLWRQMQVFGFENGIDGLQDGKRSLDQRAAIASRFLVRRVTGLRFAGELHTRNMYRREWRGGGCLIHDEPLEVPDARQRLVVALVQKKVAEVLQDPRFNGSFQVGMLSSFESFSETALKGRERGEDEGAEPAAFDQADQTDRAEERDGIDTPSLNRLAQSYRRKFGDSLPHPKMDGVARSLESAFTSGEKALVFVRRVMSVPELSDKLCRAYDNWLRGRLQETLPPALHADLHAAFATYEEERKERRADTRMIAESQRHHMESVGGALVTPDAPAEAADRVDHDTFFSWFFRGEGPEGYVSGASFRRNRLQSDSSAYSLFFHDNWIGDLLDWPPDPVARLAELVGRDVGQVRGELASYAYTAAREGSDQKRLPRLRVFEAYQQAACHILAKSSLKQEAHTVLRLRYRGFEPRAQGAAPTTFPEPDDFLRSSTFFTQLRRRPELCAKLWPGALDGSVADRFTADRFREREQRRELLAAVCRLGQPLIDIWSLAVKKIGMRSKGAREGAAERADELIGAFLDLLDTQRFEPGLTAWRELKDVAENHDLIIKVNFPYAARAGLGDLPKVFARPLSSQTPVAGMFGGINKTLVSQFRMPGYPLILITTEVLQEGEDLHTFCSQVVHYGITWTPSAMEQRTGRIDRIGSLTQRRLEGRGATPHGDELLQVYFPYLADTIEVLQVRRVFERLNAFLRLTHRLQQAPAEESRVYVAGAFARSVADVPPIRERLQTAFPIRSGDLVGDRRHDAVPDARLLAAIAHLRQLLTAICVDLETEDQFEITENGAEVYGSVFVENGIVVLRGLRSPGARVGPFSLYLRACVADDGLLLHATSPVGRVHLTDDLALELAREAREHRVKLCTVPEDLSQTYTLTAEGDILFDPSLTQAREVEHLITRVTTAADRIEMKRLSLDAPLDHFRKDLRKGARRGRD